MLILQLTFLAAYVFTLMAVKFFDVGKIKGIRRIYSVLESSVIVVGIVNYRFPLKSTAIFFYFTAPAIGYLTFLLSLFIVGSAISPENAFPFYCFRIRSEAKSNFSREQFKNLFTSPYEEFLYRGAILNFLVSIFRNVWLPVLLVSLIFALAHYNRRKAAIQLIDIFIFSVLLCFFDLLSGSVWIASEIHIVRNFFIMCFKYSLFEKNMSKRKKISPGIPADR